MQENEKSKMLHEILQLCQPEKIILHGTKRGLSSGRIKTASLCIVVPDCDKKALLRRLYLELPLDIQFNVNLYTREEWADMTDDPDSYASWINEKGTELYESKP